MTPPRRPAAALASALVLLTAASLAAAQGRCDGCISAGAASAPLDVPAGTPLAGYGSWRRRLAVPDLLDRHPHAFWFRPGEGVLDAPMARALVRAKEGGV